MSSWQILTILRLNMRHLPIHRIPRSVVRKSLVLLWFIYFPPACDNNGFMITPLFTLQSRHWINVSPLQEPCYWLIQFHNRVSFISTSYVIMRACAINVTALVTHGFVGTLPDMFFQYRLQYTKDCMCEGALISYLFLFRLGAGSVCVCGWCSHLLLWEM